MVFRIHFNSRPSARGDTAEAERNDVETISIHAPPRGATLTAEYNPIENYISIHAPPRGATTQAHSQSAAWLFQFTPLREGRRTKRQSPSARAYFNSRPSARGDVHQRGNSVVEVISIHAPPRGATQPICRRTRKGYISIHAPPRGATRLTNRLHPQKHHFNSRPSARGDPSASMLRVLGVQFQFTPLREGRRICLDIACNTRRISIHAPPRGATPTRTATRPLFKISIHAPPRGATQACRQPQTHSIISIHAPPRGATNHDNQHHRPQAISIHAPPRGATGSLSPVR